MKEIHSTQTKNHDHCEVVAIHMFLNVSDELRLVPSLLYEVVGVVSRHATFLERSLVQRSHGRNLVQFFFQFHVGTTHCKKRGGYSPLKPYPTSVFTVPPTISGGQGTP